MHNTYVSILAVWYVLDVSLMRKGRRSRMVEVPAVTGGTVGVTRFSSKTLLQIRFSTTAKELPNTLSYELCSQYTT